MHMHIYIYVYIYVHMFMYMISVADPTRPVHNWVLIINRKVIGRSFISNFLTWIYWAKSL